MTHRVYRCGHASGEPERIDADCLACQVAPRELARDNAVVIPQDCAARVMLMLAERASKEYPEDDRARGYKMANDTADADVLARMVEE